MGNNPPLTQPEVTAPTGSPDGQLAPGVPAGFPGNWSDDDAVALDEYFEAADQGPEEYGGIPHVKDEIERKTGRIIPRWINLSSAIDVSNTRMQSVFMLPADPNRKRIVVSAVSPTGTAWLLLSEQPFSLADNATLDVLTSDKFATFCPNNIPQIFVIEEHTGPLYAACNVSASGMILSVLAVTS